MTRKVNPLTLTTEPGPNLTVKTDSPQPAIRPMRAVRCEKAPDELLRILPVAREAHTLYFYL
jgi:hypothetical protein